MNGSLRLAGAMTLALILSISLVQTSGAQTDTPSSATSLALRDNWIRICNGILSVFSDVMSPDERTILQEIELRIPMDYDLTRVIAYREGGRVIEISFGFFGTMIEASDNLTLAEYYATQDPDILNKYEAYYKYLNDAIDQNEQSIGESHPKLQHFPEFAGIPAETQEQIMSESEVRDVQVRLELATIAYVLAHEIGHHVLGHVDAPPAATAAESRERESQADQYAFSLTTRAGFTAFGALPALAFFEAAEGKAADPDASHPLAGCRILGAWMYALDQLAADQKFAPLFEKVPGMLPGAPQYNALKAQLAQDCS
jgi:hypothetical protein